MQCILGAGSFRMLFLIMFRILKAVVFCGIEKSATHRPPRPPPSSPGESFASGMAGCLASTGPWFFYLAGPMGDQILEQQTGAATTLCKNKLIPNPSQARKQTTARARSKTATKKQFPIPPIHCPLENLDPTQRPISGKAIFHTLRPKPEALSSPVLAIPPQRLAA